MTTATPRFTRFDAAVMAVLFAVTLLAVGWSAQSLGFTRDEGYYFKAAESYWGWFRALFAGIADGHPTAALQVATIDKYWGYNHEHPALEKTLFAFGFGVREVLGLDVAVHNAIRFPAWCLAGLSTVLVYALGRSLLSRGAALFGALLWLSMPHVFWHMHLACFDVGVSAAHTAIVLAYLHGRRSLRGAIIFGVVFALAAAVKHNVLVVPGLLFVHWLLCEARLERSAGPFAMRSRFFFPWVFVSAAIVSPVVYLAHWPWLWPDPARRFLGYLAFHLHHEHYPILYFGDLLTHPPFPIGFPFVMSAVTIPMPSLVPMVCGFVLLVVSAGRALVHSRVRPLKEVELTMVPLGDVGRAPSGQPALLLALNAFVPFFLIALPSTPIFGGTKHWMNGLPFLCVAAAWFGAEVVARLRAAWVVPAPLIATGVLLIALPGVLISAAMWPYGLGSYNELIGFARGAANVGMQRTFWGYEPRAALPLINNTVPRGGRIHFGDTNLDDWKMYVRDGLLRKDIAFSNTVRGSAVAAVQPQGEFKEQWMDVWNEWGTRTPAVVIHALGVPVSTVTFAAQQAAPEAPRDK